MESIVLAKRISELANDVKAINVKILDLSKLSSFTNYFVVCSGTSDRQIRAIADNVVDNLKKEGERPIAKEGYEQGNWVLIDYADVVLHVFNDDSRRRYDLEGFWNRAPQLGAKEKKARPSKGRKVVRKKPSAKAKGSIKNRKPLSRNTPKKAAPKKSKPAASKKKKK